MLPGVSSPRLYLPGNLEAALWQHVRRNLPEESVGVLAAEVGSGQAAGHLAVISAIYPLTNVSASPLTEYLADGLELLRALRATKQRGLVLAAIYHSHPNGPAIPSSADLRLAEYRVPYLIADVSRHELRAFLLPENTEIQIARSF